MTVLVLEAAGGAYLLLLASFITTHNLRGALIYQFAFGRFMGWPV